MMAKVVFFKRYQISRRQAPSASPVQSQNRESLSFLGKVGDDSPLGKSHAFSKEVHRNFWNLASMLFGFWPFFECKCGRSAIKIEKSKFPIWNSACYSIADENWCCAVTLTLSH